jgi:hypothetical protein
MPDITVSDCPICARGYPLDVLAEFPTTRVTGGIEAPLPGYACVVASATSRRLLSYAEAFNDLWRQCQGSGGCARS